MKGILLVLLAVLVVSYVEARSGFWVAELRDSTLNLTNGYRGVVFGFTSFNGRIKTSRYIYFTLFGATNLNSTITQAYLKNSNGLTIGTFKYNNTQTPYNQYIYGRFHLNLVNFTNLALDDCYIIVATQNYPQGAIAGFLYQRVGTNVAVLLGTNVPGGQTVVNSDHGLGLVNAYPLYNQTTFPSDLVQLDTLYLNALVSEALVIHNVTAPTGAGIYEGNLTQTPSTGILLYPLTQGYYNYYLLPNKTNTLALFSDLYFAFSWMQINTLQNPNGDIRGQNLPTVSPRRREVPVSFVATTGYYKGSLSQTFRATQYGNDNNNNSYIALYANGTSFDSYFTFQMPVGGKHGKNVANVRQLTMNINARSNGSTWTFYAYNFLNNTWVQGFTFTSTIWTEGFFIIPDFNVPAFLSINGVVNVRITASSPNGPLKLDQFTIRPWTPHANYAALLKSEMKNLKSFFNF